MTLDQHAKIIQIIARNIGGMKPLTSGQLNLLFKQANLDYYNNKYGFLLEGTKPEANQKMIDDLQVFKKSSSISLTSGVGALPADYFHAISAYVTSGDVEVDIVTEGEWLERINDVILAPSTAYPIAVIRGGDITVRPNTVTNITLLYYKTATEPDYVRELLNGIYVYDSVSSTEYEWPESEHVALIRYVLSYLGISIAEGQIASYMEQKKSEEE